MAVQTSQDDLHIQGKNCRGKGWACLKCHQKDGLIALCWIVLL